MFTATSKGILGPVHAMKTYMGSRGYLYSFLILAVDGGKGPPSCPAYFTPIGKIPNSR